MLHDAAIARRWLLSGLAAGMALLWVLTLFGLGGWTRLDGAAPAPPSPTLVDVEVADAERLETLDAYTDLGSRPLFTPDRRPHPFVIDAEQGDAVGQTDFSLTGVMLTPTLEMAILTPRDGGDPVRVHKGDGLPDRPGWQLIQVLPRRVVFQTPEGMRQFELSSADGGSGALMAVSAGDGAGTADVSMSNPRNPQADADRHQQHQARIEAVRRRIAERRAQLRQEQAAPSGSVQ